MSGPVTLVDMPDKQRASYDALVDRIIAKGADPFDPQDKGVHLAWLTLYASATGQVRDDGAISLEVPSSKLQVVKKLIRSFDGTPTVVFTTSAQLLDVIRIHLGDDPAWRKHVAFEVPTVTSNKKGAGLRDFGSGAKNLLLTQTYRPIGLSYPRARQAIFLQRPWHFGASRWIENALPDDCEISTFLSAGTVEALWSYYGYSRLVAVSGPDNLRDILHGKDGAIDATT